MVELSNIKKNNEHVWAMVFVDYLNRAFGADYELMPEMTENSPVDMHAQSKSGQFRHLDLQLTHAVEVPFVALEEHMNIDYSKKPTIDAIERKFKTLTAQKADLSTLVLIIQGYMNKEAASEVFSDSDFAKYKDYPFSGIYYVSPIVMSGESGARIQQGVVVPIKPIENLKGVDD